MKARFIYDEVPYPSFTFPQTHPDRLATMATFNGMSPATPENCRVLELGCGDGTNLISFAYGLPDSRFVGIDLSKVQIDDGKNTADSLGLTNIKLLKGDVVKLDIGKLGKFDFIIAHGLYSWVPNVVREAILTIYQKCLAPDGVGYISYNAYPGCHFRDLTRGMMQFHARDIKDSEEKVQQGIALLNFIEQASVDDSVYQTMLKLEIEQIGERSSKNVFHDDFSKNNQPFYFYEFNDQINANNLQFLSEAEPISMDLSGISASARQMLNNLGDDLIRREQYLDFIKCRRFRATLVCHSDIKLDRNPQPSIINSFLVASHLEFEGLLSNISKPVPMKFTGSKSSSIEINHPLTKASLVYLKQIWTKAIKFSDMIEEVRESLPDFDDSLISEESARTASYFLQLFGAGFVKLHKFMPEFTTVVGDFPEASAFARWQISRGSESVTTLMGLNLKPEYDAVRVLISLLDGTRDRLALVKGMKKMIEVVENEKEAFENALPEMIESNLSKIAEAGLLIR